MKDVINDNKLAERLFELKAELAALEEKLATSARTVEDIVRHMQILKELQGC